MTKPNSRTAMPKTSALHFPPDTEIRDPDPKFIPNRPANNSIRHPQPSTIA